MTDASGRGYAKGRAKRAEIVDRATALFSDAGYRASSLREIAAQCGISHPGILHYFATKEALLIAVLEHREEQDLEQFLTPALGGVDQLRRTLAIVAHNRSRRGVVQLFTILSSEATAADHPAHDYFARRYQSLLSNLTQTYEQVRDEGNLRADVDPATAARELVALMDGLQVQWLLDGGKTPIAQIIRQHVQDHITIPLL